jgi:hypothetical protein
MVTVLNGYGQTRHRSEISGLGHKKCETWRCLITDSATNLLSFSTPTHSHNFDNHNNGYDCSKIALVRSVSGSSEICFLNGFELGKGFRIGKGYDF